MHLTPLQILLFEDAAEQYPPLAPQLTAQGLVASIHAVSSPTDFVAALTAQRWTFVLLSRSRAEKDGGATVAEVKSLTPSPHLILLYEVMEESEMLHHIRNGVADVVPRNDLARLRVAIERELARSPSSTIRSATEASHVPNHPRWHAIIQAASDGILAIDVHQRIVVFNPAAEAIFRCTSTEAIGCPVSRFIPHDRREAHRRQMHRFAEDHEYREQASHSRTVEGVRWDGDRFPIEAAISQVVVQGEVLFIMVFRDASNLRRSEADRARLEAQLQRSQKMEAIGTLAGGIAHDFNNVLGAILAYSELIKLDTESLPGVQEFVEAIIQACFRARDLIRQVLTFSRQQGSYFQPMVLSPLALEVVKLLRAAIPSSIEIRDNIQRQVPSVLADPTQLHQVLMNLATNATYAMRSKGGCLAIGLEVVDLSEGEARMDADLRPGKYVCLSVSDTGVGIPPEQLTRIFEPFYTTKPAGDGNGLGLAVARGIVRTHGGAILVSSSPGEGAVFRVLLPAIETQPIERSSPTAPVVSSKHECILFVDDEHHLVLTTRFVLERLGYEVVAEENVATALELFRRESGRFKLIITDLSMPVMDGLEFIEEVRKIAPRIPVILMSGFGGETAKDRAEVLGINEIVPKPASAADLSQAVERALAPTTS